MHESGIFMSRLSRSTSSVGQLEDSKSSSSVGSSDRLEDSKSSSSVQDDLVPKVSSSPVRQMTPPSRSRSPVKNLLLKFSPRRYSSQDNSPRTPDACPSPTGSSPLPSPHSLPNQSPPRSLHNSTSNVNSLSNTNPNNINNNSINNNNTNNNSNNPVVTPKLIKSISSPRQRRGSFSTFGFLVRGSPPRKASSLVNSAEEEMKKTIVVEDNSPAIRCHQCRRNMIVDPDKKLFLAIKCSCQGPPCYFCTRECQRIHWIILNTRGIECTYETYKQYIEKCEAEYPLAESLKWDQTENIHPLSDYMPTPFYTP